MEEMKCKDKELAKLLLNGGETKSELIDRINKALIYTREANDLPAEAHNDLVKSLSARLDTIEYEHRMFQAALHKLIGE